MSVRTVREWLLTLVVALAFVWMLLGLFMWISDVMSASGEHPRPSPDLEWTHDRGSIFWSCTDSGRALIRDTDTGSTFLDRDDRKCDAGG